MTNKPTVSIVGGGAVGSAIKAYYPDAKIFDKYKQIDPIEEVAGADVIFVAVPTPVKENKPDLSEMDDAIATIVSHLKKASEQVIVIKSTIVPGTTDSYQEKYPDANFLFNPEFLTEKTATEDFAKPDKQILGHTTKTKGLAEQVLQILPKAPFVKITSAKEAEVAKYAINSYYAFKVIFANQIYDFCEKLGIDYELVHEGLVGDKRIIDSHFDVLFGGYRGYGGKCLPKDVETLVWLGQEHDKQLKFIKKIHEINQTLRKGKGL